MESWREKWKKLLIRSEINDRLMVEAEQECLLSNNNVKASTPILEIWVLEKTEKTSSENIEVLVSNLTVNLSNSNLEKRRSRFHIIVCHDFQHSQELYELSWLFYGH